MHHRALISTPEDYKMMNMLFDCYFYIIYDVKYLYSLTKDDIIAINIIVLGGFKNDQYFIISNVFLHRARSLTILRSVGRYMREQKLTL